MGHNNFDINEKNVNCLQKILKSLLDTQISLLEFSITSIAEQKIYAKIIDKNDDKATELHKKQQVFRKAIKECEKSKELILSVKKLDVLQSMYRTLLGGKEIIWAYTPKMIKQALHFCTKNGYKEFLKLEEESKQIAIKQREEQQKIETAIKEGKKVENIIENGKIKRVIIEDGDKDTKTSTTNNE